MKMLIERWLKSSQNYTAGRILYSQFGNDNELKQRLAKGESKQTKWDLLGALQALVMPAEIPQKHGETFPKKESKPLEFEGIKTMPAGEDAIEKALHADWKAHYTRMNQLRGKLDAYGTDNSEEVRSICNVICRDILMEEKYINTVWEKLDYYRVHKKLPDIDEKTFIIPEDSGELGRLIESTKRNLRRNKQKARQEPTNPLYPSLINQYEQLLEQITAKK